MKEGPSGWHPQPLPTGEGGFLEDIRRALVACQQIGAVSRADKRLKRMNPRQQPDKIVLPAKREHGVDQIVANTCFALLDFEAVGEEIEQGKAWRPVGMPL